MYSLVVQRIIRSSFASLSRGDWQPVVARFADDAQFRFPGRNMLAGEYRDKEQIEDWFRRTFGGPLKIELEVHDVTVRGGPWNTRVCTRFTAHVRCPDGTVFHNDGMQFARLSWGKVTTDFLYEDTQMVAEYEQHLEPAAT